MHPAGLHVSLRAAWLEYGWLSRSTANLTNGGPRVGREIAARHGCPRIRFELVASPCAHALPPRINEPAGRPAPQESSPCLRSREKTIAFPARQPGWKCDFGETSGRGLRPSGKVELACGGSLRAASTSRDQSERTGVCVYCDQHTCVAWEAYSSSAWRGGVDTRHEVEISMEEWGSSVYSLG